MLFRSINDKFSVKVAEGNIAAATEAYKVVMREMEEVKEGAVHA